MNDLKTLADRLKYAMEVLPPKKIKGVELARAVGVKPPSVSDWLSGKSKTMEGENLLRAANYLGIDPVWLATGKGTPLINSTSLSNIENITNLVLNDNNHEEKIDLNHFLYVPILRTTQNHYAALGELDPSIKNRVKPLIYLFGQSKERQAEAIPRQLFDRWKNLPCYLDINSDRDFIIDGIDYVSWITQELYNKNLTNIDLILSFSSSLTMLNGVKDAIKNLKFGLAIRVYTTEIGSDFFKKIKYLIDYCNASINNVDLIIDFSTNIQSSSYLHQNAIKQVLDIISSKGFRNIIISGDSMPKNFSRDDYNPHGFIPRIEWQAYKAKKNYIFSDYAGMYPETELGGYDVFAIRPNAKIRYTLDEDYLLVVRFPIVSAENSIEQYHEICNYIISSDYYYGSEYSKGDQYIFECANSMVKGNLGTWVKVGINHHLTVVVNQIIKLFNI